MGVFEHSFSSLAGGGMLKGIVVVSDKLVVTLNGQEKARRVVINIVF